MADHAQGTFTVDAGHGWLRGHGTGDRHPRGQTWQFCPATHGKDGRERTADDRNRSARSGTDDLKGIAGTFVIHIEDGKHTYELDYVLPE